MVFRPARPIDDPVGRYPGLQPGHQSTLPAGTVLREGAKALACDISISRDIAVTLRDGTTVYVDVYRPAGEAFEAEQPAILAWSPYGKGGGGNQVLDDIPGRDHMLHTGGRHPARLLLPVASRGFDGLSRIGATA